MKKWLIALLLGVCLIFPFNKSQADEIHDTWVCVNDTSNASFNIVAGVASERIMVKQLLISSLTADNFTLECNATTMLGPFYIGSNGGYSSDSEIKNLQCGTGTGNPLKLVKGTAGTNVTVCVFYDQF